MSGLVPKMAIMAQHSQPSYGETNEKFTLRFCHAVLHELVCHQPCHLPSADEIHSQFLEVAEGWHVFPPYKDSSTLQSVNVFSGDPKEMQSLKPYPIEQTPDEITSFYRIGNDVNDPDASNYWLACYYYGSSYFMAKELPISISECVVVTSKVSRSINVICS